MMSFIRPSYSSTAPAQLTACEASKRTSSAGRRRMLAQHASHTDPSSGRRRRSRQAAHGGSKSEERRRLVRLRHVGELDTRGAAPEAIEAVEIAGVLREDVDDEIEVVEEDPLGAGVAFH